MNKKGKDSIKPRSKWIEVFSMFIRILKIVFHIGFIPTILYLGYKKGPNPGMPKFTPLTLIGLDASSAVDCPQ